MIFAVSYTWSSTRATMARVLSLRLGHSGVEALSLVLQGWQADLLECCLATARSTEVSTSLEFSYVQLTVSDRVSHPGAIDAMGSQKTSKFANLCNHFGYLDRPNTPPYPRLTTLQLTHTKPRRPTRLRNRLSRRANGDNPPWRRRNVHFVPRRNTHLHRDPSTSLRRCRMCLCRSGERQRCSRRMVRCPMALRLISSSSPVCSSGATIGLRAIGAVSR